MRDTRLIPRERCSSSVPIYLRIGWTNRPSRMLPRFAVSAVVFDKRVTITSLENRERLPLARGRAGCQIGRLPSGTWRTSTTARSATRRFYWQGHGACEPGRGRIRTRRTRRRPSRGRDRRALPSRRGEGFPSVSAAAGSHRRRARGRAARVVPPGTSRAAHGSARRRVSRADHDARDRCQEARRPGAGEIRGQHARPPVLRYPECNVCDRRQGPESKAARRTGRLVAVVVRENWSCGASAQSERSAAAEPTELSGGLSSKRGGQRGRRPARRR